VREVKQQFKRLLRSLLPALLIPRVVTVRDRLRDLRYGAEIASRSPRGFVDAGIETRPGLLSAASSAAVPRRLALQT
jgi:hypothetical protein